jgi:PKD repeat protein
MRYFFFLLALAAVSLLAICGCGKHDGGKVTADFVGSPTSGPAPLTVNFTDTSSGTVTSWAWDFNNDGTDDSAEQNPSHTYTNMGTYTVKLTATGPDGTDAEVKTDYITAQGYGWTRRIGAGVDDGACATCSDGSGNLYVAGCFQGTVNFAADWGGTDTKTSAGGNDIFITKINASGNYVWTRSIGAGGDDGAYAICTDETGNVYVAGYFEGTVNFAADWGETETKVSAGSVDIFVTKIDVGGNYRWTHRMGGTAADLANAICADGSGNVYLAGYFQGTVNFADDWAGSETKASAGDTDIFIAKIGSDGSYFWTHRMGGTGSDVANAVCADGTGNVYVAGSFEGSVNFADDWAGSETKASAGDTDVFITKIDASGNHQWTHRMGAADSDVAHALCADGSGNVYMAGSFEGSVNFASDWGATETKVSAGYSDIFITKIDTGGNYLWTHRIGGSGDNDVGYAICADRSGNIYVTGYFYWIVNFADDWSGSETKTAVGMYDIFITKIGADGDYLLTNTMGGGYSDQARAICAVGSGGVCVAGYFHGAVNFSADWGGTDIKTSAGGEDIFITRIVQ